MLGFFQIVGYTIYLKFKSQMFDWTSSNSE